MMTPRRDNQKPELHYEKSFRNLAPIKFEKENTEKIETTPAKKSQTKKKRDYSKKKSQTEDQKNTTKWRDRAEERRKREAEETNDENMEKKEENSQSKIFENKDIKYEDVKEEYKQFLGGDLKYTHLVKGVDFALLERVKSEMEKERKLEELNQKNTTNEELKSSHIQNTSSILAKSILSILENEEDNKIVDSSLHKCKLFIYDLSNEQHEDEITPKILINNKTVSSSDSISCVVGEQIIEEIGEILKYVEAGVSKEDRKQLIANSRKERKKKELLAFYQKQQEEKKQREAEMNDIFPDVGILFF